MTIMGAKPRNHPDNIRSNGGEPDDGRDDRSTPPYIFNPLRALYGFTLDAAASDANAKCATYYTRSTNGLTSSWSGHRVWCNPPFSDLASWVAKAWDAMRDGCELVVMLLPANRTEQRWWQVLVEPHRDRAPRDGISLRCTFLQGRPKFKGDSPPFGCCILIWKRAA